MKYFLTSLFLAVFMSAVSFANKDTVYVLDTYASSGAEGTLNDSVTAVINRGTLSNTVFKLSTYGLYILSGSIVTPTGSTLEIVADPPGNTQATAPPMIAWTPSSAPSKVYNFDVAGGIIMKNVWLLYGSTDGTQSPTELRVGDSVSTGGRAEFDNVIFDYSDCPTNASGAVEIYSTHFVGKFTNCYFRNCIDTHLRYYGRALSFRYSSTGLHADSVYFENCSFANMGYVYMQEGNEYGDNVYFNHCTFLNIIQFTLESVWWYKMNVANSIFCNTYMFGSIPAQDTAGVFGGTIAIDSVANFGFSVPFAEQDRRILFANNSYVIQPWLVDWMKNNPNSKLLHQNRLDDEIPLPQPMLSSGTLRFFDTTNADGSKMFPYMNKANLFDGSDPRFVTPPTATDSLEQYMMHKWSDNGNGNWAWNTADEGKQLWPLKEDLSYANDTLKTAALSGFPLGDLYHWWPAQYTLWAAQKNTEHTYINNWLMNGVTGVKQVSNSNIDYTLSQNYPNPFNPTTSIDFSIPKSGYVSLKVYNTLGQEVATLFQGFQKAGSFKAEFNASKLASGVYLYRLESGNISIAKKLILMK
jgi:hypothetical protein